MGTSQYKLPEDFVKFLQSGRTLQYDSSKCEVGMIQLHSLEDIELVEFGVNSHDGSEWASEDPHADEMGDYVVPACDLVGRCKNHAPEGILVFNSSDQPLRSLR